MTRFVPTWEQLNTQQLAAGTVSVFSSRENTLTVEGKWEAQWQGLDGRARPEWEGSLTLTIAQWEAHGKKTRIHRTKSLAKLKITPTNAHKIPIILQMIRDGNVPLKLSEVN
jgi:hypothetical protein